jgi:beta-ureidopropionase / N-carbamoyl-L-amino-acid hydrolase
MTDSFDGLWSAIVDVGRSAATNGYRRYALTKEDRLLREWFAGEAASRGLTLNEDRMGNQWGWWGDPDDQPGLVTGSHLDSVPDGGAFDGPLGVISALAALDRLREQGFQPGRPIGVVHFGDEEGARFGVACAGSRVITGALPAERALGLVDRDGLTMAEALRHAGRRPDTIGPDPEALRRVASFVELHIEQGRGLVELGQPVAIGTHIWPHGRWRLDFPGEANHAGTTAMADRRDAMIPLAEAVLAARRAALAEDCVATIGRIEVRPGGVNAVPGATTAWLDARGAKEDAVRRTVAAVAAMTQTADGTIREESWTPVSHFDSELIKRMTNVLPDAPHLGTGAGHDAGILADAGIPAAMIFVRNPTGVSHSPAEFVEREDCLAGVDALADVLRALAGDAP